ncbi:MAG: DUF1003 domain-containing protein [Sphingomicrobium sp.]
MSPGNRSPASLRNHASAAAEFHRLFGRNQSFGDRLSDRVAAVGGSWGFIVAFSIFLIAWTALNTLVLAQRAFDPYPFIFLNLMLSMVAALQAPIIMMSQNRQAAKDRLEDRIDYETNAHAASEIDQVQEKLDLLLEMLIADKQVRARALDLMARSKIN